MTRSPTHPRFQPENLESNLAIVRPIEALAKARGVTPAQIALAWVLAKGEDLVPIPGTKRRTYLEQNAAAADLSLTAQEVATLEQDIPAQTHGARYPEQMMAGLNR